MMALKEPKNFGMEGGISPPLTRQIGVAGIAAIDRLRAINEDNVKSLAASMTEHGLINPIIVRANKNSAMGFVLIAGAHRLAAAKKLKWDHIAAIVVDASDDEARLAEIDENLCRGELTPAQRALHIAERKRIYEALHPETKNGATKERSTLRQIGEVSKADRFTADASEKTGIAERVIQRDATRGERIYDLDKVIGTSLDKGVELDALARLDEDEQRTLIRKAATGESISARSLAAVKKPNDEYVTRRSAELYPKLCERYTELKDLTREILTYYVNMKPDETDRVLVRAWEIVTEDGD